MIPAVWAVSFNLFLQHAVLISCLQNGADFLLIPSILLVRTIDDNPVRLVHAEASHLLPCLKVPRLSPTVIITLEAVAPSS